MRRHAGLPAWGSDWAWARSRVPANAGVLPRIRSEAIGLRRNFDPPVVPWENLPPSHRSRRSAPSKQGPRILSRLEVSRSDIHGRSLSHLGKVASKPRFGALAADAVEMKQEFPVDIELRGRSEPLHQVFRLNRMDAHSLHLGAAQLAI